MRIKIILYRITVTMPILLYKNLQNRVNQNPGSINREGSGFYGTGNHKD